jgi:hypothetical protein
MKMNFRAVSPAWEALSEIVANSYRLGRAGAAAAPQMRPLRGAVNR